MLKYSENKEGTWKHAQAKEEEKSYFEEIKDALEETVKAEQNLKQLEKKIEKREDNGFGRNSQH